MAQNEINQYNEADETNVDITGTPVAPNQMYPYHVDDAFRKLMGALARLIGSASIVAAGTTNLGSLPGEKITVTGNATINSFGTIKAGTVKFLNFTGTPTLTHNATSLILPAGENIVVGAGDTAVFASEGAGNWRLVSYTRASVSAFPIYGSNTNGEYVKYPDGTLICYARALPFGTVTNVAGALFNGTEITWTFPLPFVGLTPVVSGGDANSTNIWMTSGSLLLISGRLNLFSYTSIGSARSINVTAIGRWK